MAYRVPLPACLPPSTPIRPASYPYLTFKKAHTGRGRILAQLHTCHMRHSVAPQSRSLSRSLSLSLPAPSSLLPFSSVSGTQTSPQRAAAVVLCSPHSLHRRRPRPSRLNTYAVAFANGLRGGRPACCRPKQHHISHRKQGKRAFAFGGPRAISVVVVVVIIRSEGEGGGNVER